MLFGRGHHRRHRRVRHRNPWRRILTVLGLSVFMKESVQRRDVPFAWFGFLSLSLGIGALQMMLDRGQDQGWFDSNEIVVMAIVSVVVVLSQRALGLRAAPFSSSPWCWPASG